MVLSYKFMVFLPYEQITYKQKILRTSQYTAFVQLREMEFCQIDQHYLTLQANIHRMEKIYPLLAVFLNMLISNT